MEHYINITGYLKFLKEVESLQKPKMYNTPKIKRWMDGWFKCISRLNLKKNADFMEKKNRLSNISTVNMIHHHPPKHITPGDPGITHLMIRSYQHSCHPAYLTENWICNGICVPVRSTADFIHHNSHQVVFKDTSVCVAKPWSRMSS